MRGGDGRHEVARLEGAFKLCSPLISILNCVHKDPDKNQGFKTTTIRLRGIHLSIDYRTALSASFRSGLSTPLSTDESAFAQGSVTDDAQRLSRRKTHQYKYPSTSSQLVQCSALSGNIYGKGTVHRPQLEESHRMAPVLEYIFLLSLF
jgi:hypothetical protein